MPRKMSFKIYKKSNTKCLEKVHNFSQTELKTRHNIHIIKMKLKTDENWQKRDNKKIDKLNKCVRFLEVWKDLFWTCFRLKSFRGKWLFYFLFSSRRLTSLNLFSMLATLVSFFQVFMQTTVLKIWLVTFQHFVNLIDIFKTEIVTRKWFWQFYRFFVRPSKYVQFKIILYLIFSRKNGNEITLVPSGGRQKNNLSFNLKRCECAKRNLSKLSIII